MFEVRPLREENVNDLPRFVTGYRSDGRYRVTLEDTPERTCFLLEYEPLAETYQHRWELTAEDLDRYRQVLREGVSLGVYVNGQLAAIGVAETHHWNRTLYVWEVAVLEPYRRRGAGRVLMDALAEEARAAGLRAVVLETQNTNATAIAFYRQTGFGIEGVDVSYYTNEDLLPGGGVAIFMKRRIEPKPEEAVPEEKRA